MYRYLEGFFMISVLKIRQTNPDEEHFKQLIALWNHNNMRILILGMLCRTLFFYCTDEVSENELLSKLFS